MGYMIHFNSLFHVLLLLILCTIFFLSPKALLSYLGNKVIMLLFMYVYVVIKPTQTN